MARLKVYRLMGKWQVGEPGRSGVPFSVQYDEWREAVKFAILCSHKPHVWKEWSSGC